MRISFLFKENLPAFQFGWHILFHQERLVRPFKVPCGAGRLDVGGMLISTYFHERSSWRKVDCDKRSETTFLPQTPFRYILSVPRNTRNLPGINILQYLYNTLFNTYWGVICLNHCNLQPQPLLWTTAWSRKDDMKFMNMWQNLEICPFEAYFLCLNR